MSQNSIIVMLDCKVWKKLAYFNNYRKKVQFVLNAIKRNLVIRIKQRAKYSIIIYVLQRRFRGSWLDSKQLGSKEYCKMKNPSKSHYNVPAKGYQKLGNKRE